MSRPIRTVTLRQEIALHRALGLARQARDVLKEAGAQHAADYQRAAIKSIEGALRHAQRAGVKL